MRVGTGERRAIRTVTPDASGSPILLATMGVPFEEAAVDLRGRFRSGVRPAADRGERHPSGTAVALGPAGLRRPRGIHARGVGIATPVDRACGLPRSSRGATPHPESASGHRPLGAGGGTPTWAAGVRSRPPGDGVAAICARGRSDPVGEPVPRLGLGGRSVLTVAQDERLPTRGVCTSAHKAGWESCSG